MQTVCSKIPYCCIVVFTILLSFSRTDAVTHKACLDNNNGNVTALDIYTKGPLLDAIQMHEIFEDSKHFVDMPMKQHPAQIMAAFHALNKQNGNDKSKISKAQLTKFVESYFSPPGSELTPYVPSDYQEFPTQLMTKISNETYRKWALELNKVWKLLTRKMKPEVKARKEQYSILYLENPIVIPGGRFREIYYWDTYWIIQGLCTCGMVQTAKGVVQNLLNFVKKYGFVPNGSRIYYLTRSQPPLLSEMVNLIFNVTNDHAFLEEAVPLLDIEYKFWMKTGADGHAVEVVSKTTGESHLLNHYTSFNTEAPRPESYREDIETANYFKTKAGKVNSYQQIIAGAESGWDFSSRWMEDGFNLSTLITSSIIPVDLNSIMAKMEENLMNFHKILNNPLKSENYKSNRKKRLDAIDSILWSETDSMWKDYLTINSSHSSIMSISNFVPLWSNCYDSSNETRQVNILNSLKKSNLVNHGFHTTTFPSGQQWDGENAWPPLQDLILDGLRGMKIKESQELAKSVAKKWIESNLKGYVDSKAMFEKYNASYPGGIGSGGEYEVQLGFGWSNGVVLKLLTEYTRGFN